MSLKQIIKTLTGFLTRRSAAKPGGKAGRFAAKPAPKPGAGAAKEPGNNRAAVKRARQAARLNRRAGR